MRRFIALAVSLVMAVSLAACGSGASQTSTSVPAIEEIPIVIDEDPIVVEPDTDKEGTDEPIEEVIPENSYRSELTNEWISEDLKDQRPVAIMVDNEKIALPHFGTSDADIVYELVNSTLNGRITRFMCIIKDWKNIEQFGSVRSTRPTNCYLFPEYNAILVHDGGPFMIDEWLSRPNAKDHLSGGFARYTNGKNWEYTEYVTADDYTNPDTGKGYDGLLDRIKSAGFDTEYNEYYMGPHFNFSDKELSLSEEDDAVECRKIELPYDHNSSTLTYDEKTKTYIYSEYNNEYTDALYDDGRGLSFKNVIIQGAAIAEYGNGYLIYDAIKSGKDGWFITDGYAVPIYWEKKDTNSLTRYYRADTGDEITLNTGKTYITYCPLDSFSEIEIN